MDVEAAQFLSVIASVDETEEALKTKEQAIYALGELYARRREGDKVAELLSTLRPYFASIPKARTAKVVRTLIDQVAKIPDSMALQMRLCNESIEWCKAEKRSFLRQRIQTRLAALLLEAKQYTEALALLGALQSEVKKLDDKPLLVEINLVESHVHYAIHNIPKSKAALTAARTAANAIYCPPILQAQIDVMAGSLHAEESDYKTAFSYFYESYENFESVSNERAVDVLKCMLLRKITMNSPPRRYMLLCKIMMNSPEDVTAIISGKSGAKHAGPALEAMRAVAAAHQKRSLHDFEAARELHRQQLVGDKIISRHLSNLYDMLLQENICRLIEPYATVETAHIATLMQLPVHKIEEKLSQMILDKKFRGILDAGAGCLIIYEDQAADGTYDQALETLGNMGRVVDALYDKAQKLGVTSQSLQSVAAKA